MTRMFASLGLVGRYSVAKDIEILILCHQLAVVQRCDPRISRKLNGADRAWLALLAGLPGRQLQRHHLRMGCGRPATDRRDRSNADDRADLPSRAGRSRHDRSRRGEAVGSHHVRQSRLLPIEPGDPKPDRLRIVLGGRVPGRCRRSRSRRLRWRPELCSGERYGARVAVTVPTCRGGAGRARTRGRSRIRRASRVAARGSVHGSPRDDRRRE
jgi:hypothetical protein